MKTQAITIGGERICTKCGERKPLEDFPLVRKDPKPYRGGQCGPCRTKQIKHSPWSPEKYQALKAEKAAIVAERKKAACMDCGQHFPACAMDFDHVRGTKKAGIAQIVASAWSVLVLLAELAKCELVCACCHRVRTESRRLAA